MKSGIRSHLIARSTLPRTVGNMITREGRNLFGAAVCQVGMGRTPAKSRFVAMRANHPTRAQAPEYNPNRQPLQD